MLWKLPRNIVNTWIRMVAASGGLDGCGCQARARVIVTIADKLMPLSSLEPRVAALSIHQPSDTPGPRQPELTPTSCPSCSSCSSCPSCHSWRPADLRRGAEEPGAEARLQLRARPAHQDQEPGDQGVASTVLNTASWAGHWPEQNIKLSFSKLWRDKFLVKINA